jgi:hypothetical protein
LESSQLLVAEGKSSKEDITKNSFEENRKKKPMKVAFSSVQECTAPVLLGLPEEKNHFKF